MKAKSALLLAVACAIGAVSSSAAGQTETRYFSFVTPSSPSSTGANATIFGSHEFVIAVNDPTLVQQMERILHNHAWPGDPVHILGSVVRGRVPYNEEYPFHLDPGSIQLFFQATEQCDATAFEVEEHIELVGVPNSGFLQNGIWCPWESRLVREIRYPFPSSEMIK